MERMQENFVDSIDLLECLRVLWKNILLIALAAVLVGALAFMRVISVAPQYQATASMFVNSKALSLGAVSSAISPSDLSGSGSLVSAYLYIMNSRTTMEEIIQEADLAYTPEALKGMISTKSVNNTGAFEVTVTSTNPAEAELIANTIAKILPIRISDIVDGTSVRIVDYAIIPSRRSGPNIVDSTTKGLLLGAVLGAAFVIVRFLLTNGSNEMIKSADELRMMYPGVAVLAMIPDMQLSERKSSYYSYYGDSKAKKHKNNPGKRQGA